MSMFDFIEDEDLRTKAEAAAKEEITKISSGIDAKIEEAVSGLKNKNQELLDEKKSIQETLKNFENIDPDKAREALSFLDENEEAQMLKDGKFEELLAKKTSTMRSDHEAQVNELATDRDAQTTRADKYQDLYERKVKADELRAEAIKQGVRPEALDDVIMRGDQIFSLDDNHKLEARDAKGELLTTEDKKVLTPKLWVEHLADTHPHYWPGSEGTGAQSTRAGAADDLTIKIQAAADAGDTELYRALRKKQRDLRKK